MTKYEQSSQNNIINATIKVNTEATFAKNTYDPMAAKVKELYGETAKKYGY